jgi:hypothetical protein
MGRRAPVLVEMHLYSLVGLLSHGETRRRSPPCATQWPYITCKLGTFPHLLHAARTETCREGSGSVGVSCVGLGQHSHHNAPAMSRAAKRVNGT